MISHHLPETPPEKPPFYPPDLPPDRPRGHIVTNATTGEQHEVLPVTKTCNGWRTEAHCYCANRPGFKTTHLGTGRCIYHDMSVAHRGLQRYYMLRDTALGALAQEIALVDPDPANIADELYMARAIFVDWIQRYERFSEALIAWHESYQREDSERPVKPVRIMDIAAADRQLSTIASLALQFEESRLKDAVSQGELVEILREVGLVVDTTVTACPHCHQSLTPVLDLIRTGWQRIQLWGRRKAKREVAT